MAAVIALSSCQSATEKQEEAPLIGKFSGTLESKVMTSEILSKLGRVGGVTLSPDGKEILYGVSYVSLEQNKSNRELFVMNIDGSNKRQLTHTPTSESEATWIAGSKQIAFLSSESGDAQLWVMDADGSNRKQVSQHEGGIGGFLFSPDETKVLYFANIKYGESCTDLYPDLPKANAHIVSDLMYKHWDEWVSTIPHPFVATYTGSALEGAIDIMEGEPYEAPMKPFGGISDLAWSKDGKTVAYASRKKTGLAYSISTNSDIYLYNIESGKTTNLTEGMMGYDTNPTFSPDGKYIAWKSMERDGYESDKIRLFIHEIATGKKSYLTEDFDTNVDDLAWREDSKAIYALCPIEATEQLFEIEVASKAITQITTGNYDYSSVAVAGDKLIAMRHSMASPDEIYSIDLASREVTELSFENKEILEQLNLANIEKRWITTTDNKKMLTWVIYPPNFDPLKQYPALLYCQGGPQSPVSQFWSYRWNMQLMAAHGYIVVAPNRRGLPGFGQEWLEQISGDYGGQNMKDYLSAIDNVKAETFVDENRLGAVGASYGGFSVYWLAGHHNNRFKAFIAHAGIFNLEQQYLETEELWFANWDMGGAYWDKNNKVAQRTYANSPHRFVDKWDTPILVTHGEHDYRILASQGMSAFNAAKLRGIPAEMAIFPDENHWILQPQNSELWQRVYFRWLDRWLKPTK